MPPGAQNGRKKIEARLVTNSAPQAGHLEEHTLYKDDMEYRWRTNRRGEIVRAVNHSDFDGFRIEKSLMDDGVPFPIVSRKNPWHTVKSLEQWEKDIAWDKALKGKLR